MSALQRRTRRSVLATLGIAGLAGCLDRGVGGSDGDPEQSENDDSPQETGGGEPTERTVTDRSRGGAATAIEVREPEWDGWVEYLDEKDKVRYVRSIGPGGRELDPDEYEDEDPPEEKLTFSTTELDRWLYIRGNEIAADAAAEHARDVLDVDYVFGGVEWNGRSDPADRQPAVRAEYWLEDDDSLDPLNGELTGDPVTIDELADATPESVAVTYVLDDHEFEVTRDVIATYREKVYEPG